MRRRKPEHDRGKLQASPRTGVSPASAGAVIDRGPGAQAPDIPFRGLLKGAAVCRCGFWLDWWVL